MKTKMRIIPENRTEQAPFGADGNDASASGAGKMPVQTERQSEVAQEVGRELHLSFIHQGHEWGLPSLDESTYQLEIRQIERA